MWSRVAHPTEFLSLAATAAVGRLSCVLVCVCVAGRRVCGLGPEGCEEGRRLRTPARAKAPRRKNTPCARGAESRHLENLSVPSNPS